jgi:hypothetical protein
LLTDDDPSLLEDLLLPALEAEFSRQENIDGSAEERVALLHDLADVEHDERDQEQALAKWIAHALYD